MKSKKTQTISKHVKVVGKSHRGEKNTKTHIMEL